MKQHYLIPGIMALIAVGWLYMAITRYGIWSDGPLGGFMPLIASIITLGFSLSALVKFRPEHKPWHLTIFIPGILVIAMILVTSMFGMLASLFFMLLLWFRGLAKYPWGFSVVISASVILCVWLIFSLWLSVPFPAGWIMNQIM